VQVVVAGRMMLKRVMGKASFATIQDGLGPRAPRPHPAVYQTDATGEDARRVQALGHGRHHRREGVLFKTKVGELSVKLTSLRLITKSLRPLPDKFHGLADQELKYRQRYVDLIMNEETRRTFKARTAAMSSIRRFMAEERLHGSRDADAAPDSRRRGGQAVHHAPQRAGHGDVPAHRARAVPEAPGGRRLRPRVRGQPQLPQ
jgi:aspartyl-tRNA synthetase